MNIKIVTSLNVENVLSDLKVYYFSESKNIDKVFLYIPCFNYNKDVIKFFSNCFEKKDYAFVTFDIFELDQNEMSIALERLIKYINHILVWIKKHFNNPKIYLLAESWAGAIASLILDKFSKKIEKMIIWNLPSGEEYEKTVSIYNYEIAKKEDIDLIKVKQNFFNKKILTLSSPKLIEKLFKFDLLKISHFQYKHLKDSQVVFDWAWKFLINSRDISKIFLIESTNNVLCSKYVQTFCDSWLNNISFIEGHHMILMNFDENKNLFKKIEEVVYKC